MRVNSSPQPFILKQIQLFRSVLRQNINHKAVLNILYIYIIFFLVELVVSEAHMRACW